MDKDVEVELGRKITVFRCGGDLCPIDGKPHDWSGPTMGGETWQSATCAKCGLDAMSWSLMNAP